MNRKVADTSGVPPVTAPYAGHILRIPRHEVTLWAGHAFNSLQLWGKTSESTLSLFGIRYNRTLASVDHTTIKYSIHLNLHAHYTYPEFTYRRNKSSVTGAGFSPLGFQFNFMNNNRLQPYIKTSAGFMFLRHPFPDARGTKTNFTFALGGGLEYRVMPHAALSLGYRFYHLSNGETGEVNPGIDSSFFYGGITFF